MVDKITELQKEKQELVEQIEYATSDKQRNELEQQLYDVEHSIKILQGYSLAQ